MKITVLEEPGRETEVVIYCAERSQLLVQQVVDLLEHRLQKIPAQGNNDLVMIEPQKILYGEFVGRSVFLYTETDVLSTHMSLSSLEQSNHFFFRCSKSMVVNISHITCLKSEISGRVLSTLSNGEQIMISRHYASSLRRLLNENA